MVKLQEDKLSIRAQERTSIYGLLSKVYSKEPDQKFLKNIRKSDFLVALEVLGLELDKHFKQTSLKELTDELAVEYTRLFIGPGKHIYPYESAYCDEEGIMFSKTAVRIKNLIESSGLRYESDFHENFDHISVELEFMQKLTSEESKAWKKKDEEKGIELLKFERKFIDEHMVKWIPKFSDEVIKQARRTFYCGMAKLTKEYILFEVSEIKNLIRQFRNR